MLILSASAIQNVVGAPNSILDMGRLKDTVGGYSTWDSDIIKVHDFAGQGVGYMGQGVYVAVLDTGLVQNWRGYFPSDRIRSDLGRGFVEDIRVGASGGLESSGRVHETNYFADSSGHGTFVTSIITGYLYNSSSSIIPAIPPIVVRGIAPRANIIPVKVPRNLQFFRSHSHSRH